MKELTRYISIFLLLGLSNTYSLPAFAEKWTNYGEITNIFTYSSRNKTYVAHSNLGDAASECMNNDTFVFEKSSGMSSEAFSLLLTAYTTRDPDVKLLVNGCDAQNRAIIDIVFLKRR